MTDNLKPCPFCGKENTVAGSTERMILGWWYACEGCFENRKGGVHEDRWNTRPIEDELNRRIAKAKDLLNAEMGMWRSVPTGDLPDHFIQLRQVLDVLDEGDHEPA